MKEKIQHLRFQQIQVAIVGSGDQDADPGVGQAAQGVAGQRVQQDMPQRPSGSVEVVRWHVGTGQQWNPQQLVLRMMDQQVLGIEACQGKNQNSAENCKLPFPGPRKLWSNIIKHHDLVQTLSMSIPVFPDSSALNTSPSSPCASPHILCPALQGRLLPGIHRDTGDQGRRRHSLGAQWQPGLTGEPLALVGFRIAGWR